jgi:long-chain fatty acid transport protein
LFERQFFAPGFEQHLAEDSVLGVAAIIAYQRFSTASLGMMSATTPDNLWLGSSNVYSPYEESGYGTGVRLALRQEIVGGLAFETGFQSRIDMEEFAQFRGVYSNPADLDIPARASVGLQLQASQRSWVNVAVERVLYSDISAFPSRYLPNRFLALLGDSTSPNFEWEDLTVYTVGWTWSDGDKQQWHVDYSTRQQPSPSSLLLSQALESDLADNALTVGYGLSTSRNSRLNLNAAYAPSEFAFGGSVLGVTTEDLSQRFELEALWTVSF